MSIWQTKNWQDMLKESKQAQEIFEIDWVFIEKRSVWLWEYWLFILWIKLADIEMSTYKKFIDLCKEKKSFICTVWNYTLLN